MTCPRLLMSLGKPNVPPRLPRSVILPFSQMNACTVGIPVVSFGVEFVYENPVTCPLSFTYPARAPEPPRVPKSRITPRSHRKDRVWVAQPRLKMFPREKGSGIVLA